MNLKEQDIHKVDGRMFNILLNCLVHLGTLTALVTSSIGTEMVFKGDDCIAFVFTSQGILSSSINVQDTNHQDIALYILAE